MQDSADRERERADTARKADEILRVATEAKPAIPTWHASRSCPSALSERLRLAQLQRYSAIDQGHVAITWMVAYWWFRSKSATCSQLLS